MGDETPQEMPPWEGLSALVQAGLAMFELFQSLRTAGFTEPQALQLTALLARGGDPTAPPG